MKARLTHIDRFSHFLRYEVLCVTHSNNSAFCRWDAGESVCGKCTSRTTCVVITAFRFVFLWYRLVGGDDWVSGWVVSWIDSVFLLLFLVFFSVGRGFPAGMSACVCACIVIEIKKRARAWRMCMTTSPSFLGHFGLSVVAELYRPRSVLPSGIGSGVPSLCCTDVTPAQYCMQSLVDAGCRDAGRSHDDCSGRTAKDGQNAFGGKYI